MKMPTGFLTILVKRLKMAKAPISETPNCDEIKH